MQINSIIALYSYDMFLNIKWKHVNTKLRLNYMNVKWKKSYHQNVAPWYFKTIHLFYSKKVDKLDFIALIYSQSFLTDSNSHFDNRTF